MYSIEELDVLTEGMDAYFGALQEGTNCILDGKCWKNWHVLSLINPTMDPETYSAKSLT
jgi:hypothetical protein